jgi:hypothetical protein
MGGRNASNREADLTGCPSWGYEKRESSGRSREARGYPLPGLVALTQA